MQKIVFLGEIKIYLKLKNIKNVHLSVNPPDGNVTLVAPIETRIEVARAYAISKLDWIRKQQKMFKEQSRENPLRYVERESHYLWGRRYLLSIRFCEKKPYVQLSNKEIILNVKREISREKYEEIMQDWYRWHLHAEVPKLITKWQDKLGVKVNRYFLHKMRTKWGSCNSKTRNIRLNTQLAKKPKDLLEYVVVHEIAHLLEPTHNQKFFNILQDFYPSWREARLELNELPIPGY